MGELHDAHEKEALEWALDIAKRGLANIDGVYNRYKEGVGSHNTGWHVFCTRQVRKLEESRDVLQKHIEALERMLEF